MNVYAAVSHRSESVMERQQRILLCGLLFYLLDSVFELLTVKKFINDKLDQTESVISLWAQTPEPMGADLYGEKNFRAEVKNRERRSCLEDKSSFFNVFLSLLGSRFFTYIYIKYSNTETYELISLPNNHRPLDLKQAACTWVTAVSNTTLLVLNKSILCVSVGFLSSISLMFLFQADWCTNKIIIYSFFSDVTLSGSPVPDESECCELWHSVVKQTAKPSFSN